MTPPPADPEYWKNLYGDEWGKAADAVKKLHEIVIQKCPDLAESVKFGHGATTNKKVKIPPGEKHEADISYFYDYKLLCHIQVSAPQKGHVPPGDIWILEGKYKQAVNKAANGEKTWFYFEYPLTGYTYALDLPIIKPFEKNIEVMHLKTNGTGRKPPESYIKVPYYKSPQGDALITWIEKELSARKKS